VGPTRKHKIIKISARIKLEKGEGLWPAFWLLPQSGSNAKCSGCGVYGTWASSGELDIMESKNTMNKVRVRDARTCYVMCAYTCCVRAEY
jgi:hypothetical protein